MRRLAYVVAFVVLAVFAAGSAFAAPSAKFTANVPSIKLIDTRTTSASTPVLKATIKTPNQKDLLIGVSLETGLYTQTKVAGKNGEYSSSNALANIEVEVRVDNVIVNPGSVVFDKRSQTLSAVLGGVIESCQVAVDPDTGLGTIDISDNCVVTNEMIELILDTMAAHHFNFVAANLAPGEHVVEVWAKITSNTNQPICGTDPLTTTACADAYATVGYGSLTIEEVRATNNPDGISFEFQY